MTTVCPVDTCRCENPDSARHCLRCGTRFDLSESPPTDNPAKFSFDTLEQDEEPSSWKLLAAIVAGVAVLAAGVFIVNARAKEGYDPQANVQEIAEVVNEAHRNGCQLFISVGASSDETDATLTKNAKKEADGVRGASVAAYDVGSASSKDMVTDATGGRKQATFVATVVALACE